MRYINLRFTYLLTYLLTSNYVSVMRRFQDTANYWSKMANSFYTKHLVFIVSTEMTPSEFLNAI